MLRWAVIFGLIAVVAALFGYCGFSRGVAMLGRVVFAAFLTLTLLFAGLAIVGIWEMNW